MKKWVIAGASLLLLLLISSYFFIPAKIVVARTVIASANQTGVYRFLNVESNWPKWWPGSFSVIQGEAVFESGGYRFKKTKMLFESFEIIIEKGGDTESSLFYIFLLNRDSAKITWNTTIHTGNNPFTKILYYFKAKETGKQFNLILEALQKHLNSVKNIYGIDIRKEKVRVEFLVSAKMSFASHPSTENIYDMINQIKNYISQSQAKEEDYPMVHITPSDSSHFEAQVAIPVNKYLPGDEILSPKMMLKGGDILVTEISGGKNMADSAMKQMEQYVTDYKYVRIAIPFQSLVADRMKEPDSSKWKTKIYYPIM